MLQHVAQHQRIETTEQSRPNTLEFFGRVRAETLRAGSLHARRIGVDADAVAVDMAENSTDSTANVQQKSGTKPSRVPAVELLGIENSTQQPATDGELLQSLRICLFGRCRRWHGAL